jgi:hypothetical protein
MIAKQTVKKAAKEYRDALLAIEVAALEKELDREICNSAEAVQVCIRKGNVYRFSSKAIEVVEKKYTTGGWVVRCRQEEHGANHYMYLS